MRTLTIEIGGEFGFDVVDDERRRAGGLSWDEMLGQVATLTHPQLDGKPLYRMQTREQWGIERAARAARAARIESQRIELIESDDDQAGRRA